MTSNILWRLLCAAIGYLFGGILTGEIVARLCTGKSARQIGTGNPGMANMLTHVGKKAGVAVLTGDALKTLAACAAAYLLANSQIGNACLLYAGLGTICGHDFPMWAKTHGGKGVAVTCTWLALYLQLWGIGCCAAGGVLTLITGYLPLGAAVLPLPAIPVAFVLHGAEGGLGMVIAALLMLSRHYRGLHRILTGKEPRFFRDK